MSAIITPDAPLTAAAGDQDEGVSDPGALDAGRTLGSYRDEHGRPRRVVACAGAQSSVLVIDEDARTLSDRRLVAHLHADEPAQNAALVCEHYLAAGAGRRAPCLSERDLCELPWVRRAPGEETGGAPPPGLLDVGGRVYAIELVDEQRALRWTRRAPGERDGRVVSVRCVVGALQAYQPACALTLGALDGGQGEGRSTVKLARELERLWASPLVLNRGLRDAVGRCVASGEVSLSQIAARCGRAKCAASGLAVGDTTWLGRRIGTLPEAGKTQPTVWVGADVLGLIARTGLGIDPREVELA